MSRRIHRGYLAAFAVVIVAILVPWGVRRASLSLEPTVELARSDGWIRTIRLADLERMPSIERRGRYQNQYGNWRDEGVYTGVPLTVLLAGEAYDAVLVIAADGYRAELSRARVEDPAYPVVLAYALDGRRVPEWEDGYRIAVLPESGEVGNEDYGLDSAGSVWVKNVIRIRLQ